jgi:hypothetical protein
VRILHILYDIAILTNFHLSGMTWDEDLGAFIEASQTPPHLIASHSCAICDSQSAKKRSETPTLGPGCFLYLGTTYHELDFVYVLNDQDEDAPYIIAQVLSFDMDNLSQTVQVQIRQLEHYDNLAIHNLDAFNWKKDEVCIKNLTCYVTNVSI